MSISASLGELLGNAQARALPETLSEHILEAAWAIFFVSKSSEDTRTHPAPRLLLFSLQGTTLLPSTGVPGGGTRKPVNPGQLQGKGELPAGLGGVGAVTPPVLPLKNPSMVTGSFRRCQMHVSTRTNCSGVCSSCTRNPATGSPGGNDLGLGWRVQEGFRSGNVISRRS